MLLSHVLQEIVAAVEGRIAVVARVEAHLVAHSQVPLQVVSVLELLAALGAPR